MAAQAGACRCASAWIGNCWSGDIRDSSWLVMLSSTSPSRPPPQPPPGPAIPSRRTACCCSSSHRGRIDFPADVRIDHRNVGIGADRKCAFLQVQNPRGIDRHLGDRRGPVEIAGLNELGNDESQRSLQSGDAEGGLVEFLHLLFLGMRGVVAGDAVDRAVLQPGDDRLDVLPGPAAADASCSWNRRCAYIRR